MGEKSALAKQGGLKEDCTQTGPAATVMSITGLDGSATDWGPQILCVTILEV